MKKETQRHKYKCRHLSENKLYKRKPKFRKIYGNNVSIMKEILTILKENMNTRDKETNQI